LDELLAMDLVHAQSLIVYQEVIWILKNLIPKIFKGDFGNSA